MARLLIAFGGTGHNAEEVQRYFDDMLIGNVDDPEHVIQIYLSGCQALVIGGKSVSLMGSIDPDLDVVAKRLRTCFTGKYLSIADLRRAFGPYAIVKHHGKPNAVYPIDSIAMTGFSRGAVSTFAAARALDDLDIPMHLLALNPVPGDSYDHARSNRSSEFGKNFDLSSCRNLQNVQVVLGACERHINPLHDTYFKEMGVITPSSCETILEVIPRRHHNDFSNIHFTANRQSAFFSQHKLAPDDVFYDTSNYSLSFTPKILRQNFHQGLLGRTQASESVKQALQARLNTWGFSVSDDDSFKKGQTHYALFTGLGASGLDVFDPAVLNEDTPKEMAMREFIVQFDHILNHVFDATLINHPSLKSLRLRVYQDLNEYHQLKKPDYSAQKALKNNITNAVLSLNNIPAKQKKELKHDMDLFLEKNCVFHLDLTDYLRDEEAETYVTNIVMAHRIPIDHHTLVTETDPNVLAVRLHELSHHSEKKQKNAHKKMIPMLASIVTDNTSLAKILRYFSPQLTQRAMLSIPLFDHIKSLDDLNHVLGTLFTEKQRKLFYHACKQHYSVWFPKASVSDIEQFKQYFSMNKQREIQQLSIQYPREESDIVSTKVETIHANTEDGLPPNVSKASLKMVRALSERTKENPSEPILMRRAYSAGTDTRRTISPHPHLSLTKNESLRTIDPDKALKSLGFFATSSFRREKSPTSLSASLEKRGPNT